MTETKPRDPGAAARHAPLPALWWDLLADRLAIVDQTRLPGELVILRLTTAGEIAEAIRVMRVRGAPAIGVAAAYGLAFGARDVLVGVTDADEAMSRLRAVADELRATRPTAVNLGWALDRGLAAVERALAQGEMVMELPRLLQEEADSVQAEDEMACDAMGRLGARLIRSCGAVLTHCNAGALATSGIGTALAPIYRAHARGWPIHVYVDETRPALQGARLTAWELARASVPTTLITDGMAASIMRRGEVKAVLVGADRIAANGDVANKIGTYGLAIIAREHHVPFYVVAPRSTIDLTAPNGDAIPIEQRDAREVTEIGGVRIAPEDVMVANPAFDVTPARYVTAIITEVGVARPPIGRSLTALLKRAAGEFARPGDGPIKPYSKELEEARE